MDLEGLGTDSDVLGMDFKMKYNVWASGALIAEGVSVEEAYDLHALWTIVYNAPCHVQEIK